MLFQSDGFLVAFTNRSAHVQTSGYSGSQNTVLVLPLNNHHFDLEQGAGYELLSQEIMTKPGKKQLRLYCSNTLAEHNVCIPWFFPTLQGHQGGSQRTKGVKGFSTRPLTTALLSLPPAQQNKRPTGVQLMNDLVSEAQRQSFGPESFSWLCFSMKHGADSIFNILRQDDFLVFGSGQNWTKISDLLQTQPPTLFSPHLRAEMSLAPVTPRTASKASDAPLFFNALPKTMASSASKSTCAR